MNPAIRLRLPSALVASLALHSLLVLAWSLHFTRTPGSRPAEIPDSWTTDSVEVGTVGTDISRANEPGALPRESAAAEPAMAGADPSLPEPPATPPSSTEPTEKAAPKHDPKPVQVSSSQPRRKAPRTQRAASSSSAPRSTPALADSSALASAPTGSLGAVGLPPGVRHLIKAFARALPEGGHRDPAWSELPLGPAGRAVLSIFVDGDGRIEKGEIDEKIATPDPLRRMIERTLLLLKSGTFSLDRKTVGAGVERVSIEVTLSQEAIDPDELGAPLLMAKEGHQAPEPSRPGYARFTLNSGRHLEAVLRVIERK